MIENIKFMIENLHGVKGPSNFIVPRPTTDSSTGFPQVRNNKQREVKKGI